MSVSGAQDKVVKVIVVDDSAVIRKYLKDYLGRDPRIEVVATANDPYAARSKLIDCQPDVMVLDIQMPRMDGLTFLRKLMEHHPLPVIIFSSVAQENSIAALDAFSLGAIDVVCKPGDNIALDESIGLLQNKIMAAAEADMGFLLRQDSSVILEASGGLHDPLSVIAIGASTGGPIALELILKALPRSMAPIAIAQHMPRYFTGNFAKRLDSLCDITVKEAEHGEKVLAGHAYIAPGDRHLQLCKTQDGYTLEINKRPRVLSQRPSADLLFESAAKEAGVHGIGVLLTGMGQDGAHGMLKMKEAGAMTIAQEASTCVIPGMPVAAVKLNAATRIVPLERIATSLVSVCLGPASKIS